MSEKMSFPGEIIGRGAAKGKGGHRAAERKLRYVIVNDNHTLKAALLIGLYAVIIGYTDNHVRVIANEIGLWQFHLMRTAMAAVALALAAPILGLRLRPVNARAVAARSAVHGVAMMCYFGALGFLPVPQVSAGLFTAPIFVLLISRFVYGAQIGPVRMIAVGLGFAGVLMILGPQVMNIGPAAAVPVLGGALYALGNIALREWCPQESATTMTAGFFAAMGVFGLIGMCLTAAFHMPFEAGYLLRGPAWPSGTALWWIAVQAVGSLVAVGLMVRGYQLTEPSRASIFEYVALPAAALWGWVLFGEAPLAREWLGMGLIWLAGLLIVLRGR